MMIVICFSRSPVNLYGWRITFESPLSRRTLKAPSCSCVSFGEPSIYSVQRKKRKSRYAGWRVQRMYRRTSVPWIVRLFVRIPRARRCMRPRDYKDFKNEVSIFIYIITDNKFIFDFSNLLLVFLCFHSLLKFSVIILFPISISCDRFGQLTYSKFNVSLNYYACSLSIEEESKRKTSIKVGKSDDHQHVQICERFKSWSI